MKTRILVIHFSQTGQLTHVLRAMLAPLAARADVHIDWLQIDAEQPYPFPWPLLSFFDTFPESVHLDPPAVCSVSESTDDAESLSAGHDLVILGWQVWFLSPSLPITGFMRSARARELLGGRRVITVVACRNMWTTAHRTMCRLLVDVDADLVDNVVLTDDGPLWTTFITTPLWLLTGNQGPYAGLLPRAGISERAIAQTARFGRSLAHSLPEIMRGSRGPFLSGLAAVRVNAHIMLAERIGHRSFSVWGRLIRMLGSPGSAARRPMLLVYLVFLIAIILTILPISMLVSAVRARLSEAVRREATALEAPSGRSTDRMPGQ